LKIQEKTVRDSGKIEKKKKKKRRRKRRKEKKRKEKKTHSCIYLKCRLNELSERPDSHILNRKHPQGHSDRLQIRTY
jgi:hypothetical protein